MKLPKPVTLVVEHETEDGSLWLCADDGKSCVTLACFLSHEAAETFKDALNATKASAHAMGQLGI